MSWVLEEELRRRAATTGGMSGTPVSERINASTEMARYAKGKRKGINTVVAALAKEASSGISHQLPILPFAHSFMSPEFLTKPVIID